MVNFIVSCILSVLVTVAAFAQEFQNIRNQITDFTLDNGMTFIVMERHDAPVVSFLTYADVGSVNEVKGITGISHIFEHMVFKGTTTIGTSDYAAEQQAIANEETLFATILEERDKGSRRDDERLEQLYQELIAAQNASNEFVISGEYEKIIEENGGVGLNAGTGADVTQYYYNLPSNKVELWFSLESDRFVNFVLREFYQEMNVIKEERRLRTENNPIGKLMEEFFAVAYKAHPYGEPVVGHMSDLNRINRNQAEDYFKEYYVPSNLFAAIVGDVDANRIKELAEIYFGRIPSGEKPSFYVPEEPVQNGERRVTIEDPSQPVILLGYHKPDVNHPDDAVYDAISDIIGNGRSSRLYTSLVKEKRIAATAYALTGLPGLKYPNLFLFLAVPTPGHRNQECEEAILVEIDRIQRELVSNEELEAVKTRAKASFISGLRSNTGIAQALTAAHVLTGDWQNLFDELHKINSVTAEDIQRVARDVFITSNKIVGELITSGGN